MVLQPSPSSDTSPQAAGSCWPCPRTPAVPFSRARLCKVPCITEAYVALHAQLARFGFHGLNVPAPPRIGESFVLAQVHCTFLPSSSCHGPRSFRGPLILCGRHDSTIVLLRHRGHFRMSFSEGTLSLPRIRDS